VRVTNSMANRMEGLQRPSGLLGPVSIRGARWCPNRWHSPALIAFSKWRSSLRFF